MRLALLLLLLLSPLKLVAQGEDPKATLASFKKGCHVALEMTSKPLRPVKAPMEDLVDANNALGYVTGFFDAAKQVQNSNPDVRLLDPAWKGCGVNDYLKRVVEILDSISSADPENQNKTSPSEVLGIALRSREGLANLNKPR